MNIGTHNSMSYLPPKKWYLYPFRFMAKCQSKSIEEQYKLGARMFDIRVSFDGLIPEFRHGSMAFKGDVSDILNQLNNMGEPVYIRFILEVNKLTKGRDIKERLFIFLCGECESTFTNLRFFCGRRKYDWKQLYKFKLDDIDVVQKVSSMEGTKIDDLWPWLYARLFNRKSLRNHKADKWLLIDFIEYGME